MQTLLSHLFPIINVSFSKNKLAEVCSQAVMQGESLAAFEEVLDQYKIEQMSIKIGIEDLPEISFPAIAHCQTAQKSYFVVLEAIEGDNMRYFDGKEIIKESISVFAQKWSGNLILLAADENSGESKAQTDTNQGLQQKAFPQAAFRWAALAIFGIYLLAQTNDWQTGIWLFLQFVGLGIATLLLINEFGEPNAFIQKICHLNTKTDCTTVLKSDASKIFSWLSWSELGFIYFVGTIISYIINPLFLFPLWGLGGIILPLTLISIFYQWGILKMWCVLCLGIVAVLWLSFGVLTFGFDFNVSITQYFNISIIQHFMGYVLAFALWFFVKPFIENYQKSKNTEKELHRFVNNTDIFKAYLSKQRNVGIQSWENELIFGNQESPLVLTVVSNPFCKPCALAHQEVMEWGKYFGAKIIYRFVPNQEEKDHEVNLFIEHLCHITDQKIQESAINDWYENKEYALWTKQYPVQILNKETKHVERYAAWSKAIGIEHTPTIFINGYELKEPYNFTQLKYLLSGLVK